MKVRVLAPCRLHFGLLHVPVPGLTHDEAGQPIKPFGGLGLMLDEPFVEVSLEESSEWRFTGSLAERARKFVEYISMPRSLSIHADGPLEHIGLGVGTVLSLSIAKAAAILADEPDVSVFELARRAGRGERSRVGMAGFEFGGFLVDRGHDGTDALAEQYRFPANWRIVLFKPPVRDHWHGDREMQAFQIPRSPAEALATTARLDRLAEKSLQALLAKDFASFAAAIGEYNRVAGEPFAVAQGGPYTDPMIAALIEQLHAAGHRGAGQSSWGPTVFVLCERAAEAEKIVAEAAVEVLGVSRAAKVGAIIEAT